VDSLAEVDGSGSGWRNWGKVVGIGWDSDDPAIKFSHSYLALQAAVDGVGIVMARRVLAADDFASGRLVRLARTCPSIPARFAYYFVTRDEPDVHGRALVSWLKAQLAAPRRPDLDT
jgi:LysR family transcriptional regulator, glycine cleavage system transcriptional activator